MYVAQVWKHAFGQNDVNLFLLCRKYNLENDYNAVRDTPSLWQNTRIKKSSSGSLASIEGIKMYEPGYNLTRSTKSFLLNFCRTNFGYIVNVMFEVIGLNTIIFTNRVNPDAKGLRHLSFFQPFNSVDRFFEAPL